MTRRPPGATPTPLQHWLGASAASRPERSAVVDLVHGRHLDYAALSGAVASAAETIRAAGLGPGDRLGIAAGRNVETLIWILAAVHSGVAYVPFDLDYPARRLRDMAASAAARAYVGSPEAFSLLETAVGHLPTLGAPAPQDLRHAVADDLAYVLFTSGSTGTPKGVAMGARPLAHLIDWHARHPRLGKPAQTLLFAPFAFDVHFQELFGGIATGGTLVLIDDAVRRDPSRLLDVIAEQTVERAYLPYVALHMLADRARGRRLSLLDLVSAGEQLVLSPAIRALFAAHPEARLHNHYGPTESHVVTALTLPGEVDGWPAIAAIGKPLPHVEIVAGPGSPDEGQELWLSGDCLAHGYLGRPDLEADRFITLDDGRRAYCTGDLAVADDEGCWRYLGRSDSQLKIDGFRIEPGEVEAALLAFPELEEAAVGAVERHGLRSLAAWLVLARDATATDPAQFRARLQETLPDAWVPLHWIVLDELPKTPSGKLDRRALPAPPEDPPAQMDGDTPATLLLSVWRRALNRPDLSPDASVFDSGARSLVVLRVVSELERLGMKGLGVAAIYDHPSVAGQLSFLGQRRDGVAQQERAHFRGRRHQAQSSGDVAIVGYAARVADCADAEAFRVAMLAGHDGLRRFTDAELDPSVPLELRRQPNFVGARGVLSDAECFDAGLFGIPAREATLVDPQQRLLLELAWTALEHASIDSRQQPGVGVWAGTANNSYAPMLRREAPQLIEQSGEFAAMLASEKDYVATRIAYRMDLDGPAISVHSACSTGLVAVAEAVEALRAGRCRVALAGGATVLVPQAAGYVHLEGGMESADGQCRPFDAEASGTVFASAGAMVVLKPLDDAVADGDTIHAVIRGVGVNNDGGTKASFTAPSARGQEAAIRQAIADAGIEPSSIGYVEAHGTGTLLGDPIEVQALAAAHGSDARSQPCIVGSLKSNFGHTIAAAGVLGLLKATFSVRDGEIPGTRHFQKANPGLGLGDTRFVLSPSRQAWPESQAPRRAGVSSFGVGGTNAHLIVEAPPSTMPQSGEIASTPRLLPISAASPESLRARALQLADALASDESLHLDAVQATLVRGRRALPLRACVLATSSETAINALRQAPAGLRAAANSRVVWLLPGQGSQHPGMAASLYSNSPAFAEALDEALSALSPWRGNELRALLLSADDPNAPAALADTAQAQPALFAMGYAIGRWLEAQGNRPDAIIGHSIGDYAAACLSGALSLADAARIVCVRATAMAAQPSGTMAAVRLDASSIAGRLPLGLDIAAINAGSLTVVSGPEVLLLPFLARLQSEGIESTHLKVSHAFHSASMDGAIPAVREAFAGVTTFAPKIPTYSSLTGRPFTAESLADGAMWARQVREPVRFAEAVTHVLDGGDTLFVELGPGQALSALVRQWRSTEAKAPRVVSLLPSPARPIDAYEHALSALGQLWCHGAELQWAIPATSQRATLPTYAFARDVHWFPRASHVPTASDVSAAVKAQDTAPPTLMPAAMIDRLPRLTERLRSVFADIAGIDAVELDPKRSFLDQDFDSLTLTQAALEVGRVFGATPRLRQLMEDLDHVEALATYLDAHLPPEAPAAPAAVAMPAMTAASLSNAVLPSTDLIGLMSQQLNLMQQTLAMVANGHMPETTSRPTLAAPTAPAQKAESGPAQAPVDLVAQPFGASARITLKAQDGLSPPQAQWLKEFTARYLAKTGRSRDYSQAHRAGMSDPRVVTGFNPQWKDLVYPIVADRSEGATLTDIDGNTYIDLLSCFGANLLGYKPPSVTRAMHEQLELGIEVGPQHPLAGEVAAKIAGFTGHARVAFCNTGSEAVMGAMRIARTVTGRKTIAIFTNSYHGIFDEVIVRGTRQLRSLAAAPGILAAAVENVLVLDYASDEALKVLRERGHELAAIMIEPVQNKLPTLQPKAFVEALRTIADTAGCALIFDEVVTGFRLGTGGAQAFYGVRADLCTYGKIIGGGLPLAAIAGGTRWMDALDGGHWQYGDDSFPEAGVTYFAGTFVRHPLALAAANATLDHLAQRGPALYAELDERTSRLVERLNAGFVARNAPVEAVHCASLWRLRWDDGERFVSLFYYLARFHGLHLFEQFGHFVTEAMNDAVIDRIGDVFLACLDELMTLGLIRRRDGRDHEPSGRSSPLTPGQSERWLAAQMCDESRIALNETLQLSFDGDLNREALDAAVRRLQARHPAFSAVIDADTPTQKLASTTPRPMSVTDLSEAPDAEHALSEALAAAAREDFALGQGPMMALSLFRVSPTQHVLQMTCSHLVFDGWAASVFVDELGRAYRAACSGEPLSLPEAGDPGRFAQDLQAQFAGPAGQQSAEYWKATLSAPPAPPRIGDRAPTGARHFGADTARWRLDGADYAALKTGAKAERLTLFQSLFATVAELVIQHSGQSDVVIGVPYAGQALGRHPALMADGVLELPVRVCVEADLTPAARRAIALDALADALEHPLMTQGLAARLLSLPPKGDTPSLSGILFNLNPPLSTERFAPLAVSAREGRKPGLLGELMFNFHDEGDALSLELHYATEYFSASRAASLIDGLADALSGHDPIHLLPGSVSASGSISAPRIEDLFSQQVRLAPDQGALLFGDMRWSYRALSERSNRIARALIERGLRPGDWVGLCLPRQPDMIAALLGILKAGAAYVPLDPSFPLQRLQDMADDAGIRMLVTDADNAARLGRPSIATLCLDAESAALERLDAGALPPVSGPDAPAYVIYTSGSTGHPKGVVVMHGGVVNFLASMAHTPGLGTDDRLLAVTTLSFDIAVLELLLPLSIGATTVLASRDEAADGEALKRLIVERGVTVMQATPSTWHLLLESGFQAPEGFRALCGGEALSPALAKRLLDVGVAALWNLYGPTETTVWSSLARITDPTTIHVGYPIDATVIRLLDPEGRAVAAGAAGEICIGGAGLARGYHARPELTAERFIVDPMDESARLYRTGDLGIWNADGTLKHLGRLDHQVKLRGYRIELGEIEAALEDLPGVSRAAVTVENFGPMDDRLVAHLLDASGASTLSLGTLRRALADRLPDYMLPQVIRSLDAMPLLPNGKIDRKALEPTKPDAAAEAVTAATHEVLGAAIGEAMGRLLQRQALAADENFFESGGHSLLAAQLATELKALTGQRPSLRVLFEAPSPSALAARLQTATPAPSLPELRSREDRSTAPLSLQQRRAWFLERSYPGCGAHRLPSAHRLRGAFDVRAFIGALKTLTERQPSLRTVFKTSVDGADQHVLDSVAIDCPLIDLAALAPDAAFERIAKDAVDLQSAPLDLACDAPFFTRLYRLSDKDHVFVFVVHHLVWDGWSFDLLYTELSSLYAASTQGSTAALPALEFDYGDYAAWQQALVAAGVMAAQVARWKERLDPLPPRLDLPSDRPRPAIPSGIGGSVVSRLSASTTDRLHALARANGTTLFVVLLAAYTSLIEGLANRSDLVIGVPVRGRDHPSLLPVMGFFVNALPIALHHRATTLSSRLEAVQSAVTLALGDPDVPIEELVRALGLPRDASRSALFDVMFSFQDTRERPLSWGALTHERVDLPITGATHDLNLWCVETPMGLECVFTYATDLFDAVRIEGMAQAYAGLLQTWATGDTAQTAIKAALPESHEALLQRLWADLLQIEHVTPEDNFFELGGHSLLALTMVSRVELACGKRLSLLRVGDSSLRALAAMLGAPLTNDAKGIGASQTATAPAPRGWLRRLLGRR